MKTYQQIERQENTGKEEPAIDVLKRCGVDVEDIRVFPVKPGSKMRAVMIIPLNHGLIRLKFRLGTILHKASQETEIAVYGSRKLQGDLMDIDNKPADADQKWQGNAKCKALLGQAAEGYLKENPDLGIDLNKVGNKGTRSYGLLVKNGKGCTKFVRDLLMISAAPAIQTESNPSEDSPL